MAVTESARHRLYQRLTEVVGPEEATTLMEYLPPVGWADVATKTDLDHLGLRLDHRIDALDAKLDYRFDAFQAEMNARFDASDAKTEANEARYEAAINRATRVNTLITLSILGALVAAFNAISALG